MNIKLPPLPRFFKDNFQMAIGSSFPSEYGRICLWKHIPLRLTSTSNVASFFKKSDRLMDSGDIHSRFFVNRLRPVWNADLGQEDAEFLLEHQNQIPKEFRKFFLAFTGTIWQELPSHLQFVPEMRWYNKHWSLGLCWFDYDRDHYDNLLRSRK